MGHSWRFIALLGLLAIARVNHAAPPEVLPPGQAPLPAPPFASPQVARPLSLDDLLAIADQNNPTLRQAQAQIAATHGKAVEAGLYPNPTVGYSGEQIGADNTAGEFQGAFVRQEFVTAGKLRLSRAKYLARASAAEWQAVAQQHRVHNDLRTAFYRTLGYGELSRIRLELVKSADDNLLTVQEQMNVGQANQADLHLARAHRERARLELLMAQNDYQAAWEQMTAIMGVEIRPQALSGALDGEISVCEWDQLLTNVMTQSPELASAHAKLEADRLTVQRELVQPIPNVTAQGAAGHNFELGQTVYMAQLSIPLPLFDRNQGTVQQAQADLARQQAEIRRLELDLRSRLAGEFRHYLTAWQHVSYYQSAVLPEVRSAYELRLKSYRENRETWPKVLDVQREYFVRRSEYVQHLIRFREAESRVNGYMLTGGLEPAPSPTPAGHIDAVPKPR